MLAEGNDFVLGDQFSLWRRDPWQALDLIMGHAELEVSGGAAELWEWLRNPLPPAAESRDFAILRRSLNVGDNLHVVIGGRYRDLNAADLHRLDSLNPRLFANHHPFIRHIVRRTREFLETTIDLTTNEPYLKPVQVRLHGEGDNEAIILPAFLEQAYHFAEEFCREVAKRSGISSGFLKTMLLRRVGSSKRALTVRGPDEAFRLAMVDCSRNFACHMPDNRLQIVIFTHSDRTRKTFVWCTLTVLPETSSYRK